MEMKKVKSIFVTVKENLTTGKLSTRDNNLKVFCNIVPKKTLSIGDKVSLRCAIRKFNGNFLIYVHSFGWVELEPQQLTEVFQSKSTDFERLLTIDYLAFTSKQKIQAICQYNVGLVENLTKTETLLMGYYNGEDLNIIEKRIECDKSLKYKVKNHTEKYAMAFLNKLEQSL